MAITQAQAQAKVDKYSTQVADFLGMPMPAGLVLRVAATPSGRTETAGNVITIPPDADPSTLNGFIIFELSNYILRAQYNPSNQHPYNGLADSNPTIAIGEAAALSILKGKGVPDYWSNAHTNAFLKAYKTNPTYVQQAAQSIQQGTFKMSDMASGNFDTQTTTNPSGAPGTETFPTGRNPNTQGPIGGSGTGTGTGAGAPPPPPPPPAPTGATPAMIKARDLGILSSWGLAVTPNLQNIINHSASAGWSSQQFLNAIYGQPEFHQAFPGIFNSNGSLKMSPQQYLATQKSYQSYASVNGINLSPQQQSYLFRNDVSPAEFNQRSQAINILQQNKQYFDAFNQQLKQEGQTPLTPAQQFKFVMGEGNKEWYTTWQRASTRYAAEQAGVHFGHVMASDTNVSQGTVKRIGSLGLSEQQMQQGFQQLAQEFQTLLPQARIQQFGLSKRDLEELQFGGKRQAAIAAKVSQIVANEKARSQGQGMGIMPQRGIGASGRGTQEGF